MSGVTLRGAVRLKTGVTEFGFSRDDEGNGVISWASVPAGMWSYDVFMDDGSEENPLLYGRFVSSGRVTPDLPDEQQAVAGAVVVQLPEGSGCVQVMLDNASSAAWYAEQAKSTPRILICPWVRSPPGNRGRPPTRKPSRELNQDPICSISRFPAGMLVLRDRQARRVNGVKPAPKGRKAHAAKPGNVDLREIRASRDRRERQARRGPKARRAPRGRKVRQDPRDHKGKRESPGR